MIANSTGLGFFRRAQQGMPQKQIARSFIRSILLLEFRILEYNITENVICLAKFAQEMAKINTEVVTQTGASSQRENECSFLQP